MANVYWARTGKYQVTMDKLWKLIPMYGDVKKKGRKLEKYRQSMKVYYDLYNNGLFNRFGQVRTVLGITPKHFGVRNDWSGGLECQEFLEAIESRIDQMVLDAAYEQAIDVMELSAHQRLARAKCSTVRLQARKELLAPGAL